MKSNLSATRPAFRLAMRWTGAAAITMGALFAVHLVTAAPPAGTSIGNQASASYLDPNGNTQLATSNLVQTTVQQVGSFTLTSNGAKSAAAGATVYVPHTLTNTGNGPDKFTFSVAGPIASSGFSRIEVFADADGDGLPDSTTTLCSTTTAGTPCAVPLQTVPGANGTFKFVVAYSVPSTASSTTSWTNNAGVVTATVDVASTVPYSALSTTNTDTVTLTDLAAFSVTKVIGQPAVAAGTVAWPSSAGVPVPTSGPRGTQTMYTLNYKNNGGNAGTLFLSDTLPAGLTYEAHSAVWSSNPGASLTDDAGSETDSRIEFQADSATGVIYARIPNVGPNVSGTVSFVVNVKATTAATSGIASTSNTAKYSPVTCAAATIAASISAVCDTASTNTAAFTVTAVRRVVFGVADQTAGVPSITGDTVTAPSVVPGGSVRFAQVISNTGDASDSFNLSTTGVSTTGTAFPTGTTFAWFAADNVTPLLDTTGDGVVDTGPIAAGATRTVVLQATIPSSTLVGTGPYSVVARATSAADTTKFDAVQDAVTAVVGSAVDLTNSAAGTSIVGDQGHGPGTAVVLPVAVTTGAVASVPLYVRNNDTGSLSYTFRASQSPTFPGTLPVGYTVAYSAAQACTSATADYTMASVATGAQAVVYACVTVPSSAAAGTQVIYFQVASTTAAVSTGGVVTDAIHDALTITVSASLQYTVTPSNVGQAAAGGTVTYAHTLNNTGNQTCGAFNISAAPTAAGTTAGWTTAVYIDVNDNGVIDSGDTLVTSGTLLPLAPGLYRKLLVRVFAPGGAVAGSQEIVTLTTTDPTAGCVLSGGNPTDTTTIITGQVRVVKSQATDTGCLGTTTSFSGASFAVTPGQCIVYQIVATNEGTASVQNVSLNDAIPPNTNYAGATQPPVLTACATTGLTVGTAAYVGNATTVSCGSNANTLVPGGTVTLRFAVQVSP